MSSASMKTGREWLQQRAATRLIWFHSTRVMAPCPITHSIALQMLYHTCPALYRVIQPLAAKIIPERLYSHWGLVLLWKDGQRVLTSEAFRMPVLLRPLICRHFHQSRCHLLTHYIPVVHHRVNLLQWLIQNLWYSRVHSQITWHLILTTEQGMGQINDHKPCL